MAPSPEGTLCLGAVPGLGVSGRGHPFLQEIGSEALS